MLEALLFGLLASSGLVLGSLIGGSSSCRGGCWPCCSLVAFLLSTI